jgi:glycosyltransferase involved in cell wall biosynthesis
MVGVPEHVRSAFKRVSRRCTVLGRIPHDELPSLLGDSKVGIDIHPWLEPHLMPAVPVKVIEYMASACAVVASSLPVLDALVAKRLDASGAVWIDGGDPHDYVGAAASLLDRIDSGEDVGTPLRAFAMREMNWTSEADKIVTLYQELLSR